VATTRSRKALRKFTFQRWFARAVANPAVRTLETRGVRFSVLLELETIGAKSGLPRRVPIAGRADHAGVWVISLHGRRAGWAHNVEANPKVRVRVGNEWRSGTALFEPGDDVNARALSFGGSSPLRRFASMLTLLALKTDPISVRVKYDFVSDDPRR
jgi:deazaflavin-dependent oxidoreductase (nitroreductase family)